MAQPWRLGSFVVERRLFAGSPVELWEGREDPPGGARVLVTLGGSPAEPALRLQRELALVVDGITPLLAIENTPTPTGPRHAMVERRPEGDPLAALAPLPEPAVIGLLLDLARIAERAQWRGIALPGLWPELCFSGGPADRPRISEIAPRLPAFIVRTRLGEFARPALGGLYAAPEYYTSGAIDPAAATWSIALLASFLVTGRHPYPTEEPLRALERLLAGPLELAASPALDALVSAATARDPLARPSPFELVGWLEQLQAGEQPDAGRQLSRVALRRSLTSVLAGGSQEERARSAERSLPRDAELPAAGARAGRFVLDELIAASSASEDDPLAVPEAIWRGHGEREPDERVLVAVAPARAATYDELREALAADLPLVAPLLYVGPIIGREWQVDALVEREPPGAPVSTLRPLPEQAAARLLAELAALLEATAARGVVLGGLRPQRVYVDRELGLTGVAPRAEELFEWPAYSRAQGRRRYPRRVCYRGRYAAPESPLVDRTDPRVGGVLTAAADVFSLAAIGHFLLTGRHHDWTTAPEEAVAAPWPAPRLAQLLRPALARDPRLRPRIAALSAQLAELVAAEA